MGPVNITFGDVTQRSKTFLLEMLEAKSGATSNKLETNLRLTPLTSHRDLLRTRGVCYWFVKFVILTPLTCYKTSNITYGDVIVTLTYTPNIPKECQGCLLEGFVWVSDVRSGFC